MTDWSQDPDYRGPDQENDFPLPKLPGPSNHWRDYFDRDNEVDASIDSEHLIRPDKPFFKFDSNILYTIEPSQLLRHVQHVQATRKGPTGTEFQDIGTQ